MWEAAKISVLSSGKTDKYEYLTSKEMLSSNQSQMIDQIRFAYSPLGEAFKKQRNKLRLEIESL